MQLEESRSTEGLWIDAHEAGSISIDGQTYSHAVCLNGEAVLPLNLANAADLSAADFQVALAARPEVVLVGTGAKQVFLHPRITAELAAAGIGVETMSTAAACRTYMILHSEGRRVWAWLWP